MTQIELLVMERLKEPFPAKDIEWRAGATTKDKTKAMALAYVDARAIMDRLDEVVGTSGWQDDYTELEGGGLMCRLSLCIDGAWVTKADGAGRSDQADSSDQIKASFSGALKRAAVKWGIGRYLYNLDSPWVEYDEAKRRISKPPPLPKWALPAERTPEHLKRQALAVLEPASKEGIRAYEHAFFLLSPEQRKAILPEHQKLKEVASAVA